MNKKSLLSLCLFGASTVLSFATVHIMHLLTTNKWVGVFVALSLFVVMGVLLAVVTVRAKNHIKPRKHVHTVRCIAIAVNAIADGMALSSLFVYLGRFPALWQSAEAAAVLIGLFALYLALTYIPFARKHYIICMAIYLLVIVGLGITLCVMASKAVRPVSLMMILYMIIFIAFFITLADSAHDAKEHIERVAYSSFAGVIVALIVLAIISDGGGDFLSGADAGGLGPSGANKKRNPYAYMPYDYAAFAAMTKVTNPKYSDHPPFPPIKP